MKILAIEKDVPGVDNEKFKPFHQAEAQRVWELYQAGVIREMYFQAEQSRAVLVLECSNGGEASICLGSLPLVQQGLIAFDIIPLKAYPGFERLFSSHHADA